jgi:hypothetical protein
MNFEVFVGIQPSFTKKVDGHGIDFLWAFVPARRTFQEHAIHILPSTTLPCEMLSLLGIQVKDSPTNPGSDPGVHTPFNYPNNGTDVQNSAFYHIDRVKSSTMEASGKDFPGKKATFEKGIRFQFNLFTGKLDPVIPKNMRIVRHREHGRIYTKMHEVLVDGEPVMVPEIVERKKRKPRIKLHANKPTVIENTYKYAVKTYSLYAED